MYIQDFQNFHGRDDWFLSKTEDIIYNQQQLVEQEVFKTLYLSETCLRVTWKDPIRKNSQTIPTTE